MMAGIGISIALSAPGTQAEERATPAAPVALAARAREAVARLEGRSAAIAAALHRARAGGDLERAACLDDALSQSHANDRRAQALRAAIHADLEADDARAANRDLGRLLHLGERAQRLTAQAARCAQGPDEVRGVGGTVVRVFAPALPEAAGYPGER
jgi:hypothetical protein